MGDWKKELSKLSNGKGGGTVKRCKCGNEITRAGSDICYECFKKKRNASNIRPSSSPASLPDNYLDGGYFDKKGDKQYLKEAVFIEWPQKVSIALGKQGMSPTALRKFFNKLRAIEAKYKSSMDFDLVKQDIFAFDRDVAYTSGRGVTPPLFKSFIAKNIELAKRDPDNFKGFVEHFQSVIAYFKEK